ncbi:helix-turn-helix domain-containing protein [Actinocorallia longicatena]
MTGGSHSKMDAAVRKEYLRIARRIHADAVELCEEAVRAMSSEIPEFSTVSDEFRVDLHHSLMVGTTKAATASIEGRRLTDADIASPRTFAAKIAQRGIPLEAYLKGFRIVQRVYWNAISSYALPSPATDRAVLMLSSELVRFTHLLSDYAAQGYLEYQSSTIAEDDRRRRDLAETLLAGKAVTGRPMVELARAHGITPDASIAVIVAVSVGSPPLGADELYVACAALGGIGGTDRRPLVAARHEEIMAFAAARPGADPRRLSEALTAATEELAEQGIRLAVGMSTITEGAADLPRAYAEARLALDLVGPGGGVTALPLLSPFRYLALRADPTAWHLVSPPVRELLETDRMRGGTLVDTIRAFADADLNLRAAAQELKVHHNTAQYRLQRIQERTGRNPRHIADLVELLTAIALFESR